MADKPSIRLNKVLRELNISLERAVEFLNDKGVEIDARPTTKITDQVYDSLLDEFEKDKSKNVASHEVGEEKRKEKESIRIIQDNKEQERLERIANREELKTYRISIDKPKSVGQINLEELKKYTIKYPNSNRFSAITFYEYSKFKIYDSVQVNVKNNDKNFIIYSISGINYFNNKIDDCKKQKNLIFNELKDLFPEASIINKSKKHEYDKSEKSLIHQSLFDMDDGSAVRVECYDWSKKMFNKHDLEDQLVVSILSEDFSYFLTNEAYE